MVKNKKISGDNEDRTLVDHVLSWSINDIFNHALFIDKVKKIPDICQSTTEYFEAFVFPLLEEARADLHSSLEKIHKTPYAILDSSRLTSDSESNIFEMNIDYWRRNLQCATERSELLMQILSGDIFVIVDSMPRTSQDLLLVGRTCVLAYAVDTLENDTGCSSSLLTTKVRTSNAKDLDIGNNPYVFYLNNVKKYERMWNALHMHGSSKMIDEVLQSYVADKTDDCRCMKTDDNGWDVNMDVCLSSGLNPLQKEIVVSSLSKVKCHCKPSVELVCGPPGTGKTKIISALLYVLGKRNYRTLMTSSSSVAITNVVNHIKLLLKEQYSENSDERLLSASSILLLDNCTSLGAGSDTEEISLQYRAKRLTECFDPSNCWNNCFISLLNFLKDGDFVRDKFKTTVSRVRRCVSVLHGDLPESFLSSCNIRQLKSLASELDAYETLLFQNPDSNQLLEMFPHGRNKLISVLKDLLCSLNELQFPDLNEKDSILNFCIRIATLILCDAPTCFELHGVKMEPMTALIVDDSAQLNECESIVQLQLPGLNHAILFGDEHQLVPKVISNLSSKVGYGRSLFQRLSLLNWPKHLLNIQYRMHPSINSFPNSRFYCNRIQDAPYVKRRSYEKHYLPEQLFGPYSFINLVEGREELDDDGNVRNLVEVAVVMNIVQRLYKEWCRCNNKLSIGLITTSDAQVMVIERSLHERYQHVNFRVKVDTVEGFLGSEHDVVIISTVRANIDRGRALMWNHNQINAALTRAKHSLWLIGNEKVLVQDPIWEAVISDARERKCFFNAHQDETIAQVITRIKSELDQLDDLLNKESVVFKQARWKVLFSETFVKKFSSLLSTRSKKLVLNFLVALSEGWRPKKVKSDPSCETSMKIAKQYKVGNRYIICTNDIAKEMGCATQVLKIWDYLHLEDVAAVVQKLDKIYETYSEDFLKFCKQKCNEGILEVPRCYKSFDVSRYKDPSNVVENTKVNESLLLMKFYSLSRDVVRHLLSSSDVRALNIPFEVTDEEQEVISYQRTTFVLGRSGTGKTTVLVMKIVQKEQIHHMVLKGFCELKNCASMSSTTCNEASASGMPLHQLFVTVNSKLSSAVKQHVSNLRMHISEDNIGEGRVRVEDKYMEETDEFKDIPTSFADVPPHSYPLIIPFHVFLLMLDGTVGTSYFDRFQEMKNFSFIETAGSRLFVLQSLMRRKQVRYYKFVTSYWPYFNSKLTKTLDPSRVFTEICSFIKGGLHDVKLDGRSYLKLSERRVSIFSEQEREMIYSIFSDYEKMKSTRGEFDLPDLVNDLHCRLKNEGYQSDHMDFVYIDEVQDLTVKEIALFKYICKNFEDGFVFAGDTAQTIARGVDFRFQDIRCLFYREFIHRGEMDRNDGNRDRGEISPIFYLTQNFRTHAGVLKLAQSVVELIYHFFPLSIDRLCPETSLVYGEAPILLDCGADWDAITRVFQDSGNVSESVINFGSEQVILVRDDCARDEIFARVGKHALVLTIFECKGLEFQDVLLYNFFGSSPLKDQWRVIYDYMAKNMLDNWSSEPYPVFNNAKHHVLCSELKQLYVAITRTRQRLWISENSDGISSPIFDYWRWLNVVQVRKFDESFAKAMQVACTQEDWKLRGIKMLQIENYKAAEMCFERAGDDYWRSFARAMSLKAEAETMHGLRISRSIELFKKAAEIFESINNVKEAANCYYDAADYEKAGSIFYSLSNRQRAGQCFTLAGRYDRAAEVYAEGDFFYDCLHACSEGKLFDLGLHYVRKWKHQADLSESSGKKKLNLNAIEQEFLEKCAHAAFKKQDKELMMKHVRDFASMKSKQTFLKKLGCLAELVDLEREYGNYLLASKVAREMGNILLEAELLDLTGFCRDAAVLYLTYVLATSLWSDGHKGWPLKEFSSKNELLLKLETVARRDTPYFYTIVCSTILLLKNESHSFPELRQQLSKSRRCKNLIGEILCTRNILDTLLETDVSKFQFDLGGVPAKREMVPAGTLTYHWQSWKRHVPKIFRYLTSLKDQASTNREYEDFCLGYFGVRKLSDNPDSSYFILYTDAEWVTHANINPDKRNCISTHQFVNAACRHWCRELLHVGKKLLKKLENLLNLARESFRPIACINRIHINIFEETQFLKTECKFLKLTRDDFLFFAKYMTLTAETYFYFDFSLGRKRSWSKEITIQTEASRKSLKEALLQRFVASLDDQELSMEATHAKISQVVVLLLGSSGKTDEQCGKTLSKLEVDSPWKSLAKSLVNGKRTGEFIDTHPKEHRESPEVLAADLRDSLYQLYVSDWKHKFDYITPSLFLYLADRLFVMVSCFSGCLLAARSSIIEWFIHLDWKVDPNAFGSNIDLPESESSSFVDSAYKLLADSVSQLIMNRQDTWEWIQKSDPNSEKKFPTLILRLVVLMFLICLNSGKYLELLNTVFNCREILEVLPRSFVEVMVKSDGCSLAFVLAQALLKIEDPLVVIPTERGSSKWNFSPNRNAIFLNVFEQRRDDILGVLFRRM